jgi:hypothetical protein
MPWEFWRWQIAEQYHWTLDQVDAISMDDLKEYFQVMDGKYKARHSIL